MPPCSFNLIQCNVRSVGFHKTPMMWIADFPLRNRQIIGITAVLLLGVVVSYPVWVFFLFCTFFLMWVGGLVYATLVKGIYIRKASFIDHGLRHDIQDFILPIRMNESMKILSSGVDHCVYSKHYLFQNTRWAYFDFFREILMNQKKERIHTMLVLGAGGGSVPMKVVEEYEHISVDVVENSDVSLRYAKRYFDFFPTKRLHIIRQDAYKYVTAYKDKPYDFVFMDVFHGNYVPKEFMKEAYINALFRLSSNVIINCGLSDAHLHQMFRRYSKKLPIYIYFIQYAFILSTIPFNQQQFTQRITRIQ